LPTNHLSEALQYAPALAFVVARIAAKMGAVYLNGFAFVAAAAKPGLGHVAHSMADGHRPGARRPRS
jgi:hypothetical protein